MARKYVDVLTVDDYTLLPGLDDLIQQTWGPFVPRTPSLVDFHTITRKPVIVAEYSFRAADSGVPNSWPPIFPIYQTQQERADAYAAYVMALHQAPWVVGDFWFEYVDEPAGGRFDGEDSNFGVVSSSDVPWETLVRWMTAVHAASPDRLAP
jgi:agarase